MKNKWLKQITPFIGLLGAIVFGVLIPTIALMLFPFILLWVFKMLPNGENKNNG